MAVPLRYMAILLLAAMSLLAPGTARANPANPGQPERVVIADVVAINQPIVYNRFGSANPWGMMYALRDDVEGCARDASRPGGVVDRGKCQPGNAMLKASVRPRPLVIRVNAGDRLVIRFQNLLMPMPSRSRELTSAAVGGVALPPALTQVQKIAELEIPDDDDGDEGPEIETVDPRTIPDPPNDPMTRLAGIAVVGLRAANGMDLGSTGLVGIAPGESAEYGYIADKRGSYFFSSLAAVQGGEGDGGSLTHGLFGMVVVEPAGARVFRSQVTAEDFACARNLPGKGEGCENALAEGQINYDATRAGIPILAMHQPLFDNSVRLVHGDLTAIVAPARAGKGKGGASGSCAPAAPASDNGTGRMEDWRRPEHCPYREFAIMFHDELKTVHAPAYAILNGPTLDANNPNDNWDKAQARHKQMAGARDGFAINYGASGMGTALISNRAGVGPARKCVDCAYEEFFLQSWANGDPALLPQYAHDPSNVYHSYQGDPVEFHNVHAGPKETHVFHLHAHQWLSQAGNSAANYLDSQTIGPFQTFTYQIEYGGSGNRNHGPGDSIFHCHLYPHFAQGMWGMWRVHDVFEDGSRLLPDGGGLNPVPGTDLFEWQGTGTDPVTGETPRVRHANGMVTGGTPVPAVVPLPAMPLAPEPTYAAAGMPGFPFYIPGKPGFRAPQPPLDMARDGGLPRHVTKEGVREAFGQRLGDPATAASLLNKGLENADLTFHVKEVAIELLPQDGTPLEKAAMAFHAQPQTSGGFRLNGRKPAAGAPFANPCPVSAPEVRYNASAIEMSLLVNQYGWHDPQARINVLDTDLGKFQWATQRSKRTPQPADPFFFRVHSGDCVTFQHTNRTAAKTGKDAFQVAAPTDIIGQHIHLVKFDVTSSDGSANGFNYEDGTLSRDIIEELVHASSVPGGSVLGPDGLPATLTLPANEEARYQATFQRWWADPRLDRQGKDQTLGTVFTHDHFAPSNIQQHGFYGALLVEPRKSTWRHPDGSPMPKLGPDGTGAAVGTQAIIDTPKGAKVADFLSGTRREFALAIADFALLYDGSGPNSSYAIGDSPVTPGAPAEYAAQGRPIAPPGRPEAISVDHHDPFLFNYKLEPMPVRMGNYESRWQQWSRDGRLLRRGDPAYAFNSFTHMQGQGQRSPGLDAIDTRRNHADGDPSTEIFEAYVGDKGVIRLIQGAQEVQHVFEINGLAWRRQPGDPASPRVASQETGISEHFEVDIDTPLTSGNYESFGAVDFRYGGGTVDAMWNGAWGLLRTYPHQRGALDPGGSAYWQDLLTLTNAPADAAPQPMQRVACRLAPLKGKRPKECDTDGRYSLPANVKVRAPAGTQSALRGKLFPDFSKASGMTSFTLRKFCVRVEAAEIRYNERERLFDPAAARFVAVPEDGSRTGLPSGSRIDRAQAPLPGDLADLIQQMQCEPAPAGDASKRPLVLRMNAGDFAVVELSNPLAEGAMPRSPVGNSILPPIAPSSGPSGEDKGKISDRTLADRLIPSEMVSLSPQLVALDARTDIGAAIGLNDYPTALDGEARYTGYASSEMPGGTAATHLWFAGTFASDRTKSPPRGFKAFTPFHTTRGMVAALSSLADPVKHPGMGLVGALVIEPEGARWEVDAADPTRALVTLADGTSHQEAILVYQDGLNLKTPVNRHPAPGGTLTAEERGGTASVADCHVCDDTYDSGDAAVNYRTEPFWARLNQSWRSAESNPDTEAPALVDLNGVSIPANIWTTPVDNGAAGQKVETPVITVPEGSSLVIHAVHPGGRARQRAFITYGHRYDDMNLAKVGVEGSNPFARSKSLDLNNLLI